MGIDLALLFTIALAYLGLLFLIAWCADSGWFPEKWVRSPLIYSLSLGVYATSWTYYGSVGLADSSGFAFLNIYLGLTGAFILGPYLLRPILRLCRENQLTSIADLMAFRYGGRATGLAVTLFMLAATLPYISLQIKAVTESIQILSKQAPPILLALSFCVAVTVFTILFGARHLTPREKHDGLVVAIAFESTVKLAAMVIAGVFVLTQVFDSPFAMNEWAKQQPELLENLYAPGATGLWPTLLLLAFCASFMLPRQYHMTFVENQDPRHLKTAYWLFPLYLLVLNLPIIPILFAGKYLSLPMTADFYILGMTLEQGGQWLAIIVFLGGLSAASAMMIVTTLALSSMVLNHFFLPAALSKNQATDFYRRLMWSRRLVISAIIATGFGFYLVIELNEGLASLGLISFVAAAQLLPGMFGLLFWSRATQAGFIAGLTAGALAWFALLILPLLDNSFGVQSWTLVDTDIWTLSTFVTLSINSALFILGSLLTRQSAEEATAAQQCNEYAEFTDQTTMVAQSVDDYRFSLQRWLGKKVAEHEMQRVLQETNIAKNETRRSELRILHVQLERNLSGLLGPTLARKILRRPGSSTELTTGRTTDARFLERRLEASRQQMRGLTKQVDDLRQYLRNVLRQLPIGVCSTSANGCIYIWNSAMHSLTDIAERDAYDKSLEQLPRPWGQLLADFASSTDNHQPRCRVVVDNHTTTVNLHKAQIGVPAGRNDTLAGQVILMEDRTELDTLESELAHRERLASLGRLAAGVAHEIGNPLTGIASIAQNLYHDISSASDEPYIDEPYVKEQTNDILVQVERINNTVRSLLTFSHTDSISDSIHESVDISKCVAEAVRLVRLSPDTQGLNFNIMMPENAWVIGDSNLLMQVFVNLINNACDASPIAGSISIEGRISGKELIIETIDQGPGIDPAVRNQLLEPFFTTKPVGQGTGLGLYLAYSIVNNHNGQLRIGDRSEGTSMCVSLPLRSSTEA